MFRLRPLLVLLLLLVAPGLPALAGCAAPRAVASAVTPTPALDYEQLREDMMAIRRFDAGGTIRRVSWSDDGRTLSFIRLGEPYTFDLVDKVVAPAPVDEDDEAGGSGRGRRGGPARGRQRDRETSPDG